MRITDRHARSALYRVVMLSRLALFAAVSGCSFVMMNNPPAASVQAPRCEAPVVIPVVDIVGAVASVALSSVLALAVHSEGGPVRGSLAFVGVGVGLGATFTTSSVIGFGRARRCRHAIDAWTAANP